jgi:urease accessory protein
MDSALLLRLLQVADSGFPTGAFAFSHGLEGLYLAGRLAGESEVAAAIDTHLREGFAALECPVMRHAWRASAGGDIAELRRIDGLMDACKPVPVFREGSARVGRRLLESASPLLEHPVLSAWRERAADGGTPGHHAVSFAVVMQAAGADEEMAALLLGAGFVNGLAAAAVRLGAIGQVAAQRIIATRQPAIVALAAGCRDLGLDDIGGYLPLIDIAGLRQPTLPGRIFGS